MAVYSAIIKIDYSVEYMKYFGKVLDIVEDDGRPRLGLFIEAEDKLQAYIKACKILEEHLVRLNTDEVRMKYMRGAA